MECDAKPPFYGWQVPQLAPMLRNQPPLPATSRVSLPSDARQPYFLRCQPSSTHKVKKRAIYLATTQGRQEANKSHCWYFSASGSQQTSTLWAALPTALYTCTLWSSHFENLPSVIKSHRTREDGQVSLQESLATFIWRPLQHQLAWLQDTHGTEPSGQGWGTSSSRLKLVSFDLKTCTLRRLGSWDLSTLNYMMSHVLIGPKSDHWLALSLCQCSFFLLNFLHLSKLLHEFLLVVAWTF